MSAISVNDLRKSYGEHEALRGISFTINEGEVFSLLGPNGAGKTTTVEILEGYRTRDGGRVEVLGFDPQRSERSFRERIGVVLQSSELWSTLTPLETTWTRRHVRRIVCMAVDPEGGKLSSSVRDANL